MRSIAQEAGPLDLDRLVDVVMAVDPPSRSVLAEIELSFLDTLAVAAAGRVSPIIESLTSIYGEAPESLEHAALIGATAAHALDYDDVELESSAHISAVVIPALLACADLTPTCDVAAGYIAGLQVARLIGRGLGRGHYAAGWHATSTIGAVATAAAVARMLQFPSAKVRNSIALSLCQASGMQQSFGTDAKPLQAGIASSAGVRAALWSNAGASGPKTPFGEKGFDALYGGVAEETLDWNVAALVNVARKPYPCCYGASRLISAALELRRQLGGSEPARVVMTAQTGTLLPLRAHPPTNGDEAKFYAPHLIARAMVSGQIKLADFQGDAWRAEDIEDFAANVTVGEIGPVANSPADGVIEAACFDRDGTLLASARIAAFPGSPQAPLTEDELTRKLVDCVGTPERLTELRAEVRKHLRCAFPEETQDPGLPHSRTASSPESTLRRLVNPSL